MECTQILVESDEESSDPQNDNRRQVASLKTITDAYPIFIGENRIGRDPKTCSIVFDNMALSGQHAVIEGLACGSFLLYDLNSRNKTRIGKVPLTPQVRYHIKNGDSLRFANVHCTFCIMEGIKVVHVSLDDDLDTLATDTVSPKKESPDASVFNADPNTSTVEEDIFEQNTQIPEESKVVAGKTTEDLLETAEHKFKMPGPSNIRNLNSSVTSLNKSVDSSYCEDYDDEIFDLATQPTVKENETIDLDEKEDTDKKGKGGCTISTEPLSILENSTELEFDSNQPNTSISDRGKMMLDSNPCVVEEKSSGNMPAEGEKDKTKSKQAGDEISKRSKSSADVEESGDDSVKEVSTSKLVSMSDESGEDTDPEDIFSAATQAYPLKSSKGEAKNGKNRVGLDKGEGGDKKTPAANADISLGDKVGVVQDKDIEEAKEPEDSDSDDIFSAATQRLPSKNGEKDERKNIDGKNGEFADGEDSDDDLFTAEDLPLKKGEGADEGELIATPQDGDDTDPEDVFSATSVNNHEKNIQNKIKTDKLEDGSGRDDSHHESDGEETDPDDSLAHNVTVNKGNDSAPIAKKETKANMESRDESDSKSKKHPDDENGTKNKDSPLRVDPDEDEDTDMEDMCPPSIKKPLPHQKGMLRKRNIKIGEGESDSDAKSSISSTSTLSKSEASNDLTKSEVFGEISRDVSLSVNGSNTRILADATLDDDKDISGNENQSDCLVIMSDTDDEKEMDDSMAALVLPTSESSAKAQSNESILGDQAEESAVIRSDGEDVKGVLAHENKASDDIQAKDLSKAPSSGSKSVEEKEKVGDLDKGKNNEPTAGLSAMKGSLVMRPDTEEKESVSTPDKTKVCDVSHKKLDNKKTLVEEKKGVNATLEKSDAGKSIVDLGKPVSVSDADGQVNACSNGSINIPVPSIHGNERDKVVDMTLDLTLPVPCVRISSRKTEKSTLKNEAVREIQNEGNPDKTARSGDKEGFHIEPLVIAKSNEGAALKQVQSVSDVKSSCIDDKTEVTTEDLSSVLTQPAPQVRPLDPNDDDEDTGDGLDLLQKQPATTFKDSNVDKKTDKVEKDVSSLQTQPSPDLSIQSSEKGDEEKDKSVAGRESDIHFKSPNINASNEISISDVSGDGKQPFLGFKTPEKQTSERKDDSNAPPDTKSPKAIVEEGQVDEEDLSSFETQPAPSSKTDPGDESNDEEETQAPPSVELPKLAIKVEPEDVSSLLTEAPPDFKTPKAAGGKPADDEEDLSLFDTQPAPVLKTVESAVTKAVDNEEDISSCLTQEPPKLVASNKTVVEKGNRVKESSKTQKAAHENVEDGEEDTSSSLTKAPPEFKTPKTHVEKLSDDEEDLSAFETQPAPVLKTQKAAHENVEDDKEDTSSSLKKAPPEFKKPETPVEKLSDDEEDLSAFETQPAPVLKTQKAAHENEEEDMSSFLTQAPPDFNTPKVVVKVEKEDDEDMSSFLTQAPPDFKTPRISDGDIAGDEEDVSLLDTQPAPGFSSKNPEKEKDDNKNVSSDVAKESGSLKKLSGGSDEEDLSMCETQPAPSFLTPKVLQPEGNNKRICPSSVKPASESKSSTAAVESISSDEEDLSLLETQPAPVLKTPVVVNGKQERINESEKKPIKTPIVSNVLREVTPSRRSLRKQVLLKTEKESSKKLPASHVKVEKESDDTFENKFEEQDDDSDLDLPDTPDLMNTINESIRSAQASAACRSLFPTEELEISVDEPEKPSMEPQKGGIGANPNENDQNKSEKQRTAENPKEPGKTKPAEVERRPPSRRNAGKLNQQSPEKMEPTSDTHLGSNRRRRVQKNDTEKVPPKRKSGGPSELSAVKDEPAPKRKSDLREKINKSMSLLEEKGRANQVREAKGEDRAVADSNVSKKISLRGRKKTESLAGETHVEIGKVDLIVSKDSKNAEVLNKSEIVAKVQEGSLRRGRRIKKDKSSGLKADEMKELSVVLTKAGSEKKKELGSFVEEGKSVDVKGLNVEGKLSMTPEKKTRSSRLSEGTPSNKSAAKMVEDSKQAVGEGLRGDVSPPVRKRSLRGQAKPTPTVPKEMKTNKEDSTTDLRLFFGKDEKELSPVMFYGKLQGSASKEEKAGKEEEEQTSPIIPSRKRRRRELADSPLLRSKSDSSSPSETTLAKQGFDAIRRSSRERKPKRPFSAEKSSGNDKESKTTTETELNVETKRGRRGKAYAKIIFSDSSTASSQEDLVLLSELVPHDSNKRKLEDKEPLSTGKRSKQSQDKVHEEGDSEVARGDGRSRRRGAAVMEKSVARLSLDAEEASSASKSISVVEEGEGEKRVTARRGKRKLTTPVESQAPPSSTVDELSTSQLEVSKQKGGQGTTKVLNTRGRRKSSVDPIVPEATIAKGKADKASGSQVEVAKEQEAGGIRGVRRRGRKRSSTSAEPIASPSLVIEEKPEEKETDRVEIPKEQVGGSESGARRRGRRNSNTPSELTSPENLKGKKAEVTGATKEMAMPEKEAVVVKETKRRGKRGTPVQRSFIPDKIEKLCTSTPVHASQGHGTAEPNLSESKATPASRRMVGFPTRSSSNNVSVNESVDPEKSLRGRQQKGKSFSVLFTGLSDPKLAQIVERLGGSVVETPQECSILVTDRLRRTYKLLCTVARGIPIVTVQWLAQSSVIGRFLDPSNFLISDKLTEKRFDFTLKNSLEKARIKPLLSGYSIIATPSVKPPPEEVQGIVTCAGGEYIPSLTVLRSKMPAQLYVVSCPDDSAIWKEYQEVGTKRTSRGRPQRGRGKAAEEPSTIRLVGVEGLLVSVLRQKIDFEEKMFSLG